jgi:uncharacterized protein
LPQNLSNPLDPDQSNDIFEPDGIFEPNAGENAERLPDKRAEKRAENLSGHLYLSWEQYHHTIEQLAVQIYQSGWAFNQIICLAKGGLRVGDILARLYRQPLAILAVSSYGGTLNQERGELNFAQSLTMTSPHLGGRVLLVDDLADSGLTLIESRRWLEQHYGETIVDLKTAVLWYKGCSQIQPDYYVDYLPDNPWIHQPFEVYEQMEVATFAQHWLAQSQNIPHSPENP